MLSTEEKREIRNDILKGLQKPHVWGTTPIVKNDIPIKIHVQDLKEKKYSKAISFLREHFLTSEHLCKTVDITSSQIATAHLLHLMLTWLRDGTSLEAIAEVEPDQQGEISSDMENRAATTRAGWHEENENEMIGLLVCRVAFKLEHSKTYSRFRIPGIGCEEEACKARPKTKTSDIPTNMHNEDEETDTNDNEEIFEEEEEKQLSEILKFRSELEFQIDVYNLYNVNEYLRIYVVCILPDWRGMNIEEALFKAAIEQAKLMKLTVAMIMCTNQSEQHLAERFGMTELAHQNYKEWKEESIISKYSGENSQAVLMAKTFEVDSNSDDEREILSIELN